MNSKLLFWKQIVNYNTKNIKSKQKINGEYGPQYQLINSKIVYFDKYFLKNIIIKMNII